MKLNKTSVSFYGVVDGCGPKYCGWKYVTEENMLELKNWLMSGNILYFRKYDVTVTRVNTTMMLQIWRWLKHKQ